MKDLITEIIEQKPEKRNYRFLSMVPQEKKAELLKDIGLQEIKDMFSDIGENVSEVNYALEHIQKYSYNRAYVNKILLQYKGCKSVDDLVDLRENLLFTMDGLTLVYETVLRQPEDCTEYMCLSIKLLEKLPDEWVREVGPILDDESRSYVLRGIEKGTEIMKKQLSVQFGA